MTPQEASSFYQESFQFLQARKKRQVRQLVLLNNLERGDLNIASTLLITLFNRVMSSLYDDKMQVKFLPSQGILQKQINSYNVLAQSDYLEMGKSKLDYDWDWDTLFFGRGYCETLKFNKKRKIMEPHIINPLMFGYDPYFENASEWRYYWKWVTKSDWELKKLIKNGTITGVKNITEIPSGVDPYLWDYKIERDKAKKAVAPPIESANGGVYQILEMCGYDEAGNKCLYWYDKDISQELYMEKLSSDDVDEITKWPVVVKEAFREPHSSVVFSVADLLEDKHRAKSVLLNLAFIAAKDQANPLYWYDPDKVKDITQFFSRQINQHIPVEGQGDLAVGPINKASTMSPELTAFISLLTTEANDPVGTGMVGQPQRDSGSDTATEAAITQQMNDMAQSLQSKVMQFGEAEFWSHWFHLYQKHADELDSKMANIVGVKGVDSTEVDLKDFKTDFPPGVLVYSAKEAEYKELVLRRDLMELFPMLAQTMDPDGMRNFQKHVLFPKLLNDPSLIDIMYPKTLEEIKAEGENELLAKEELPPVSQTDDHTTHIYTHRMVQPKTWATWIHIGEHEELLAQQKEQEQQMMQEQMTASGGISVGAEKKSPMAQATPLKGIMQNSQKVKPNKIKK